MTLIISLLVTRWRSTFIIATYWCKVVTEILYSVFVRILY